MAGQEPPGWVKRVAAGPSLAPAQVLLSKFDALSEAKKSQNESGSARPGRHQIGWARSIAATRDAEQTRARLEWTKATNGSQTAAMRFVSPAAQGVRLGVSVISLPAGARLRFYTDDSDSMYEISGQQLLARVQKNIDAAIPIEQARLYWAPALAGQAVTLEIGIPSGASPDSVKLAVPTLSHATKSAQEAAETTKAAASCTQDVACSSNYDNVSQSVALMEFVDGGASYICTGTLLSDKMASSTPYFLSAQHCISNQVAASTLQTTWFYKAIQCGGALANPGAKTLFLGADLLYDDALTDVSFMRLREAPPTGAVFAAWSSHPLTGGAAVYGVSHPAGDFQKYTAGNYQSLATCSIETCQVSTDPNAPYLRVGWSIGATEGGSSGSGVFVRFEGKDQLVGQLRSGNHSCSNPSGWDSYGRFELSYKNALYKWLGCASAG